MLQKWELYKMSRYIAHLVPQKMPFTSTTLGPNKCIQVLTNRAEELVKILYDE